MCVAVTLPFDCRRTQEGEAVFLLPHDHSIEGDVQFGLVFEVVVDTETAPKFLHRENTV